MIGFSHHNKREEPRPVLIRFMIITLFELGGVYIIGMFCLLHIGIMIEYINDDAFSHADLWEREKRLFFFFNFLDIRAHCH